MRQGSFRYRAASALFALTIAALRGAQVHGQTAPPATVEDALQQLATQAAVVFTGHVVLVAAEPGGVTRVSFAVEEGLRGAVSGASHTMRLSPWSGGGERYRVGERALFLLHAPSAAGYSSPVEGERGIVPLSGDAVVGSVDLRWIAAGVLRSAAPTAQPDAVVDLAAAPVVREADAPLNDTAALLRSSNVAGADVHAIDRDLVTGMLRTWSAANGEAAR